MGRPAVRGKVVAAPATLRGRRASHVRWGTGRGMVGMGVVTEVPVRHRPVSEQRGQSGREGGGLHRLSVPLFRVFNEFELVSIKCTTCTKAHTHSGTHFCRKASALLVCTTAWRLKPQVVMFGPSTLRTTQGSISTKCTCAWDKGFNRFRGGGWAGYSKQWSWWWRWR